jgi:protoporphyrinogen oxidase
MDNSKKKIAVIAGAGPAGLTAAYELLKRTGIQPIVFEQSDAIGGISQTVCYKGNRMDIGGHRFFSKSQRVTDWWNNIMPLQGSPSQDDILIGRSKCFSPNGPDPEKSNRVMLTRERVSRIYFLRKFFDYPISLKWQTFANMGLIRTLKAGIGYIKTLIIKKEETSLENFYINRFGKPLYKMFFEDYTEKVWGIHPSKLGADWGSQRVKGLSVFAIIKDIINKNLGKKQKNVETSLIESFIYPKLGPGQLWETVAHDIEDDGGQLIMKSAVKKIHISGNHVDYIETENEDGSTNKTLCDYFLSSMPLKDLVASIDGIEIPKDVMRIATELPYRDFITVGLLVKKLKMDNETAIKTYKNRIPDTWIYIQERDVKIGRLQIFNNWSPYLVNDYENTIWIGLEYFCSEGDSLWTMEKKQFIDMAIQELVHIGIINADDVIDSTQVKIKKAYPAYYGSYYELDKVKGFLNSIDNLFCIGRNGQHRYNNMDHSMMTAMESVDYIKDNNFDKTAIWAVNTEEEYHETK